jgi:SAM-dependent methyltransferase
LRRKSPLRFYPLLSRRIIIAMALNETNPYSVDSHIAEVYDLCVMETDDVELIRRLIGGQAGLRILEPFTGTGRILLPLALDGHVVTGIDQAHGMIAQARKKAASLPLEAQQRVMLVEADVIFSAWPAGFDLVILGGNCFYELATPEEQAQCVRLAAAALKPGGHVFIDNDHMEGELDPSWQDVGVPKKRGIKGLCADGSRVESFMETTWFDAPRRLVRFRRWTEITAPDGRKTIREYVQQKHPVSAGEVRSWLEQSGFVIEHLFGNRRGTPYTENSGRAIFWARKA